MTPRSPTPSTRSSGRWDGASSRVAERADGWPPAAAAAARRARHQSAPAPASRRPRASRYYVCVAPAVRVAPREHGTRIVCCVVSRVLNHRMHMKNSPERARPARATRGGECLSECAKQRKRDRRDRLIIVARCCQVCPRVYHGLAVAFGRRASAQHLVCSSIAPSLARARGQSAPPGTARAVSAAASPLFHMQVPARRPHAPSSWLGSISRPPARRRKSAGCARKRRWRRRRRLSFLASAVARLVGELCSQQSRARSARAATSPARHARGAV